MDYETDTSIVPLGSYDMILGVQWLATLGSILWNFERLTMEFVFQGRRHLLERQKNEEVKWAVGGKQRLFDQLGSSIVCIAHDVISSKQYFGSVYSRKHRRFRNLGIIF